MDSGAVSLESESEKFVIVETDDDTVYTHSFTLSNGMGCALEINPRGWIIEAERSDGWEEVAGGDRDESRTLDGGEKHEWSLSLTPHPTPYTETTTYIVADLSEGAHRFSITGRHSEGKTVTRQARFEVVKRTGTTAGT